MRALRTSSASAVLLLAALAGCGGDGDERERVREVKPLEGTFVGKAESGDAFVAVVASPVARGEERRELTLYACDAKRVCEWFSGSAAGNSFRVGAERGDGEASGALTREAATGHFGRARSWRSCCPITSCGAPLGAGGRQAAATRTSSSEPDSGHGHPREARRPFARHAGDCASGVGAPGGAGTASAAGHG